MSTHHDHHRDRDRNARLTTAAITGILAGAARAITDWLLHNLTSTW